MASVEKRIQNGKLTWLARWRDPSGASRRKSFSRRIDAERHLTGLSASLLSGTYVDPAAGRILVGTYADSWMETRSHLKPATRASYRSLLGTQVLPNWRRTALSSVTHADVVAWVAQMSRSGLSASRTRQSYHLLKSILDSAVQEQRLARNPAQGVVLPRLVAKERRYLSHAQVAALAEAADGYAALIYVLSYCGLRWSEATALRVARVDIGRSRIEVVEAAVSVNGVVIIGPPKSHQHRTVPIPAFVLEMLDQTLVGKSPNDLVFTSPRGAVLRVQRFRKSIFDGAAQEAGLTGLTPHELRHTAASLAISAGATVKAVQRMLGHASATLTLDRYGHLFPGELDAVAERLDRARAEALVP